MKRTAQCCCRRISITVKGEPTINGLCHCDNCKRRTGSAFGWSAYFDDEQIVERQGYPVTYRIQGENEQERSFCAVCGTTLYWKLLSNPTSVGIAGGAFVDRPLPEPKLSYSSDKKCAWLKLPKNWDVQ